MPQTVQVHIVFHLSKLHSPEIKEKKNTFLIKATLEVVITCPLDDLHLMYYEISSCYITK